MATDNDKKDKPLIVIDSWGDLIGAIVVFAILAAIAYGFISAWQHPDPPGSPLDCSQQAEDGSCE